ncbi:MAG: hypothetical protein KDJ65_29495 [Anaerolineae bacterium]|nr:hypothetical protein [Anaerolineae bacterium]
MSYVLGLFEDKDDAVSAIDGLVDAGFTKDEISVLSRHHLTEEHDKAIKNKRAADLGGFAGLLAGGYAGMFAGIALVTLPGIGLGFATGALPIVLGLTAGGAAGATAGAIVGHKLIPSLMEGFDISEEDANFYAEAVKREGVLIAVDADGAKEEKAREVFEGKHAVDIEERRKDWHSEGWERFDDSTDFDVAHQNVTSVAH